MMHRAESEACMGRARQIQRSMGSGVMHAHLTTATTTAKMTIMIMTITRIIMPADDPPASEPRFLVTLQKSLRATRCKGQQRTRSTTSSRDHAAS